MRFIGITKGGNAGSYTAPPENPINVFLMAGQSNADEGTEGFAIGWMTDAGISNPGYSEDAHPGKAFTKWYGSGGFGELSTDGTDSPETTISCTASQSGGTATLVVASPLGADFDHPSHIVVAGADQSEYNGIHQVTNDNDDTDIEYAIDSGATSPATGTITVRHAGFREVFLYDIELLAAGGDYINIIGMGFMQGEGNVGAAVSIGDQWKWGNNFIESTYDWVRGTLSQATRTTIDRDFTIAVGLTAILGNADVGKYVAEEGELVRNFQKRTTDRKEYAYWVETIHLARDGDGIHLDPADLFPLLLQSILNKTNVRPEI